MHNPVGQLTFLQKLLSAVAAVMIVAMMLHVVADMASRLVFRQSLTGTVEVVSHYYMVAIIFLPLAGLVRRRELIAAELIDPLVGPGTRKALGIAADLLLAAWFFFFAWLSTGNAIRFTGIGAFVDVTTGILPIWPTYWFLPVGSGAAALFCLVSATRRGEADTQRSGADDRPFHGGVE